MKKLLAIIVLSLLWSVNTYAVEKKKPLTVVQEIKQLGVFSEPSKYPEGMIEFFMPLIAAIIKGIKYKAIIMINANASIKIYTIFLNLIQGTWQQNAPYKSPTSLY